MSVIIRNRSAEKACARERDEERPRRREIFPSEIQRENLIFRRFRKDVTGLKPDHVEFVFDGPKT
jgi:hypothetical protein